jgi:hypothetical protein
MWLAENHIALTSSSNTKPSNQEEWIQPSIHEAFSRQDTEKTSKQVDNNIVVEEETMLQLHYA